MSTAAGLLSYVNARWPKIAAGTPGRCTALRPPLGTYADGLAARTEGNPSNPIF